MKRTFTKQRLVSLVTGVFLFAIGLLSSTSANAQLVWMQTDQALPVLKNEVSNHMVALKSATPGTPAYEDALRHAYYYKAMYRKTSGGMSVEDAANASVKIFANTLSPGPASSTSATVPDVAATKAQKGQLYLDAVNLLTL